MNKYRRAKSRQIKKLQREMGFATYKEAKRLDRRMMHRAMRLRNDIKYVGRQLRRGLIKFRNDVSEVTIHMAKLSQLLGRSNMFKPLVHAPKLPGDPNYIIDEAPIEEPTEMWPKENPYFQTRRLGKFVFKEAPDENSGD